MIRTFLIFVRSSSDLETRRGVLELHAVPDYYTASVPESIAHSSGLILEVSGWKYEQPSEPLHPGNSGRRETSHLPGAYSRLGKQSTQL